jgi:autotransporter-associated beta strand protein
MALATIWDGGAPNGFWLSATNWDSDVAPVPGVDGLAFAGTSNLATTNDFPAGSVFNGLSFSSGAGAFILNGNTLVLGGNVSDSATVTQKVNLALGLGSAARSFTVVTNGQLVVNQPITGTPGLVKDGSGTLTLGAVNSYAGSTTISNGTVRLAPSGYGSPVTGMLYWLDAADSATITLDASSRVSQWRDKSGNARHFAQAAAVRQPLLVAGALSGRPVLRFDGVTNRLVLTNSTVPQTVFIVNKVATVANLKGIWGVNQADTGIRMTAASAWQSPGNANDFSNPSGSVMYVNRVATNTFTTGAAHLLTVARASSTTFATTGLGDYFYVSGQAPRPFSGDIAEVLVYGSALTTAQQQQVEAYLTAKWLGGPGSGSDLLPTATAVNLTTSGATLDLNGTSQGIGSLAGVAGSKVILGAATLTIGSNNSSATFSGVISGTGALSKRGTGTLSLGGTNTFTGSTTISAGAVKLLSAGSLASSRTITLAANTVLDASAVTTGFTVNSGQLLTGAGSVTGLVRVASGGTLAPGSGVGTLTLRSGLTLSSNAAIEFQLGPPSDLLRITGGTFSGNTNGATKLSLLGTGGTGPYTLIDWNGAATSQLEVSDFTLASVPAGFLGSLAIVSNTLRVTLTPLGPQTVATNTISSLRLAIEDLAARYPVPYSAKAVDYLQRLGVIEANFFAALAAGNATNLAAADLAYQLLKREALVLNNPALAFNRVMFVKRTTGLGLPANWQNVSSVGDTACNDRIGVLDITNNVISDFYVPATSSFVGYLKPHWNGDRLLFTSQFITNSVRSYAVFEMKMDGTGLNRVSPFAGTDVDWYDACYLPCGELLMCSTAPFAGVPCVTGGDFVGNLYRVNPTNGVTRQLTFDQDQNWGPTILSDGRVMFTRWEYSDTPHYFSRILFTMMPDGLEQFARYGSSSFFPNTLFDAQPIPGKPSQFVAIISGHHGVAREGELMLFDETKGMTEAEGVLHRFCGPNPVLPEVRDRYVDERDPWPRFVQPAPLDEKQLLVSARTAATNDWGVYLVDQFDNICLLHYQDGASMLHPTPIKVEAVPPVIPDRVKVGAPTGTVNIADVHFGPGLAGVPRGKVKSLRVYSVHYAYRNQGGHINVAVDGGWDAHRILGTVPVYEDGSASFTAPANTPISVQPLDDEGKALALFRSWYTVMPGESVSCAGCHERRNDGMMNRPSIASRKAPDLITPWHGPERGFSFVREVQPVLDQYCAGCHGGIGGPTNVAPDLATTNRVVPPNTGNSFPQSYLNLHRYVRRPGNEGYFRMNSPGEWHADTSELIQILQKGHYGVALDTNAWDRLVTWIDLNVPAWGTWGEHSSSGNYTNSHARRLQTMASYASLTNDPELYPIPAPGRSAFVAPTLPPVLTPIAPPPNSVFDVLEARTRRNAATNAATPAELTVNLGGGVTLVLDLIPAGTCRIGSASAYRDEAPQSIVTNSRPFYVGKFEIMNQQYALFDPAHHSGFVGIIGKDHCSEGWPCNALNQPAIRVSWAEAMKYCEWLTKRTGRRFTLPTEAQWEYACRAGTTNDMWYGPTTVAWTNRTQLIAGDSFYRSGALANLAGLEYYNNPTPNQLYSGSTPPWYMCNTSIRDAWVAPADGTNFASNPFGLCAMHGNAAEWTLSTYAPYPYSDTDGRNRAVFTAAEWLNLKKVVRGGSCLDREKRATASFRTAMYAWERGYNVGFRVVADAAVAPAIPTAAFSASPTNGLADLAVNFDGCASSDPDGALWQFEWSFGDGTAAVGTNRLSHTYSVAGTYTATLTVTDGDGFTGSTSRVITVRAPISGGAAPVAQFTASPSTSAVPSRVTFDGRASTDPDGAITAYYWNFGDDTFGSGATAAHTYTRAGRFHASLSVVDNSGLRDTRTATVVVTGASGNQAPTVDAGISGVVGVTNAFNLRGFVSDDGRPSPPANFTATWSKLKGPGAVTFGNPAATNTTARFGTNGTYVLQLSANDGELSAGDTITVTVLSQDPYRSPSEVAYSTNGALLAVADATAQSVVMINPVTGQVLQTIPLAGEPRDLVWRGTNSLFVSEHGAGTIVELNAQTGDVMRRLKAGPKPAGLALVPGKQLLLVTDRGLNKLSILDLATGKTRSEVSVVREPVYVAVTPDEKVAIVANHLPYGDARDPDQAAAVSFVNLDTMADVDHLKLPAGSTVVQRIACSPDGRWAYVLHVLGRSFLPTTQLSRGWVITSAMTIIDLQTRQIYATMLFDQSSDGAADPWGLALSQDGKTLWASLSGVHEIGKLNLAGLHTLLAANPTLRTNLHYDLTTLYNSNLLQRITMPGEGPRGLALSPNQSQLAAAAYYAGQVFLLNTNGQVSATVALGAQPAADSIRRGERLYYDANGCYQRWLSCNSCHPGARADGMNWDLMNDGFGNSKNTKSHLFAPQTPPSMWTGIRGNAMVGIQAGYKFIEFQAHPQADYDDIHAFMTALTPEPSPYWVNGKLTPDALQGKAIFESAQTRCLECHKPGWYYGDTNKYNVGTLHGADYTSNDTTGYIPPNLYELWRTAPYLHDGSAMTMREVLTTFNAGDLHGVTSHLTPNQIDQLAAYMLQLCGDLPSGPTNPYSLAVLGGTGGGHYLPGSTVTIAATVPDGSDFLGWFGDALMDPLLPVTTLLMPETNLTVFALVSGTPTISPIADQITSVGTALPPIAFTVGDDATPASNLTVTATSSNPALLPIAGIVLTGTGANRWVTLQPSVNQTGNAIVTVTVSDGLLSASETFLLTVVRVPALTLTQTAGELVITWPAEAGAFNLFTTDDLAPGLVWTLVTNAATPINDQWSVVLPSSAEGQRFYRLQTP